MKTGHIGPVVAGTGDCNASSDDGQNRGKFDRQTSQMTEKAERRYFAREGVDPLTPAFCGT